MTDKSRLIGSIVGLGLTAVILISATAFGYRMRPYDNACEALDYTIVDSDKRQYVTEAELDAMLKNAGLYPVGYHINQLSLHRIEQTIIHHPMVRTAECFITPRNEMRIYLSQRVPLLRVQTASDVYFIDTDRRVMEARESVKDSVLVAKGAIGVQMATTQLTDFAIWLQRHEYWRKKVDYIRVQTPQMVTLCLKGEQPRVVLGSLSNYEQKLAKLRTFLDNRDEQIQAIPYKELDVRFKGQVIGRK